MMVSNRRLASFCEDILRLLIGLGAGVICVQLRAVHCVARKFPNEFWHMTCSGNKSRGCRESQTCTSIVFLEGGNWQYRTANRRCLETGPGLTTGSVSLPESQSCCVVAPGLKSAMSSGLITWSVVTQLSSRHAKMTGGIIVGRELFIPDFLRRIRGRALCTSTIRRVIVGRREKRKSGPARA